MFSIHNTVTVGGDVLHVFTDATPDVGLETMVFPSKGRTKRPDYCKPLEAYTKRHKDEDEARRYHDATIKAVQATTN